MPILSRRDFHRMVGAFGIPALSSLSGCGTLMHPERRDQVHTNQIDWRVAALDGLGLILFFVPGVAAFAVDFYTGAIYLPPEEVGPQGMEYIGQAPGQGQGPNNTAPAMAQGSPTPPILSPPANGTPTGQGPVIPASSRQTPTYGAGDATTGFAPAEPRSLPATRRGGDATTGFAPAERGCSPTSTGSWRQVAAAQPLDSPASVERVVARCTGVHIALHDEAVRASQVPHADQLNVHLEHHQRDRRFGFAAQALLRRWRGDQA